MIEKIFKLGENNTNIKQEIVAGFTTFATLSYIIFVQPAVLSAAGMDYGSALVATCLASAIGMLLMAFLTNYPIALAPAMGHNFYFTYVVCLTMGVIWQQALGAVFIAGIIFIALSLTGLREKVMDIFPDALRNGIPVGIGLLIALIGLEWSGIVTSHPVTYVTLGDLHSKYTLISIFGLIVIAFLLAIKFKGAILTGIIGCSVLALILGVVEFNGVVSSPPSIEPSLLKLQIPDLFANLEFITVIIVFLFLDLFDTIGTLVGVGQLGGFMKNGKLPKAKQALLSDAVATSTGALLGTSTVTSYIESSSGISAGGRTGLTNVVTAILMIAAIFFTPLIQMVGAGIDVGGGKFLYPVIAPALIIVGSMMMTNVKIINWDDYTESIPAFLTIIIMPLSFSITEGIAFGFISYSLLKIFSGKAKEVNWIIYLISFLFIARYIWLV
ncbi:MAG TPA: NCS2 family permease [Thermodesulfobacteriota bacterium]|nr:NCS2 family permease [Thermodesulfobacteriota bacterium]